MVGYDFVCGDFGDFAESVAGWAGTPWRVEAKHAWFEGFEHDFGVVGACAEGAVHCCAFEAFEFLLLAGILVGGVDDYHGAFAGFECGFDGFGDS